MDFYELTYIFLIKRKSTRLQKSIMSDVDEVLLEESGAENELDVRAINLLICMANAMHVWIIIIHTF